jgi:hypothetical protein
LRVGVGSPFSPPPPSGAPPPHSTTLENKMLAIAYERDDKHFPFYTQIENRFD